VHYILSVCIVHFQCNVFCLFPQVKSVVTKNEITNLKHYSKYFDCYSVSLAKKLKFKCHKSFHPVSFLFRKINDSPVKIINLGCGGGEYSQQRQQGRQEGGEGGAEEGPQPNSDTPGRACALSAGGQVRYTPHNTALLKVFDEDTVQYRYMLSRALIWVICNLCSTVPYLPVFRIRIH
jgi:hypothetical protein